MTLFDLTGPFSRTMNRWTFPHVHNATGQELTLLADNEHVAKVLVEAQINHGIYTKDEEHS